ncbi:hypothetical protein GGX14DRAFT_525088 [Mycena pura]|uniref:SEP-domain-containing protein n=1 Tax=Mycena pura TaxID=153505 RepID=A0AAD6Y3M8_9AGAR|nr:hypothetical protein GGX14DRAFT_525088 [Mycena pura]
MSDDNSNVSNGRTLGGSTNEPLPEAWVRPTVTPRVGRIGGWPSSGGGGGGSGARIGTLRDIESGPPSAHGHTHGRAPPPNSDGEGSEDDGDSDGDGDGEGDDAPEVERWFAGGERSGISVENPDGPRQRVGPNSSVVRDLLRRAAETGAAPHLAPARPAAFFSGGYVLGSDEVESRYVPGPDDDDPDTARATRHLTFWRDGFTVENSPLMRYDDPQHEEVLAAIHSGLAPPAILDVRPGQPVEVIVAKRTGEDYVPPRTWGGGVRLGASVPGPSDTGPSSASVSASASATAPSASGDSDAIAKLPNVDESQPIAQIQVRLANGNRFLARLNNTHTVADLRDLLDAAHAASGTYTLHMTFPTRQLEDAQAVGDAKLGGAVVVQRME